MKHSPPNEVNKMIEYPEKVIDVLKKWDKGETVWSVEMGGQLISNQ